MLCATLWYTRNGAVRVTHWPFSYSRVGSMSEPAGPAPLMPNRLWSLIASALCPHPDSSIAWAIVTAAGMPYRLCAASAPGATSLMKACCAAVPGTCAAGGLFLVYDGVVGEDDPRDVPSGAAACRPGIAAVPPRWPLPARDAAPARRVLPRCPSLDFACAAPLPAPAAPMLAVAPLPVATAASAIMPGTATMACVPTLPARPAVPAILAVPFPAARPALAVRLLLDVSAAVPVPGTAAPPAFADAEPPASAEPPAGLPPAAWLTALSSSPLLTKPVTPWPASGPVNVCALTERFGLESPPIV